MGNKFILYYLLIILITSVLYSCSEKLFFESKLEIPNQIWESEKAAVFDFNITDTLSAYNLTIGLLNTNDYRNSNLWLFVYTSIDKRIIAADTLEYFLYNEKGKCLGESNGDTWLHEFRYGLGVRFPQTGKYTVKIVQGMRESKLKGIKQLGLKIEKIK